MSGRANALLALALAAVCVVGLAASCEPSEERKRQIAAEEEAAMLGMAAGDTLEEATFRRDSAALAASLAVDTVEASLLRTRVVRYLDEEDGTERRVTDTVYTIRGRRLGFCDDVTAELARTRVPGDTLTCQWGVAVSDTVQKGSFPYGAGPVSTGPAPVAPGAVVVDSASRLTELPRSAPEAP